MLWPTMLSYLPAVPATLVQSLCPFGKIDHATNGKNHIDDVCAFLALCMVKSMGFGTSSATYQFCDLSQVT